jgi:hypothetical protein
MKRLFWMLRYALIINARSGLPLRDSWQCAATAYDDLDGHDYSPSEAVDEELACWTD